MNNPSTHVTHASGLDAIVSELAFVHGNTLRPDEDDDLNPGMRLSVLTLVAVCADAKAAALAAETVGYLAESHPARALIVVANGNGGNSVEADIRLHDTPGQATTELVLMTVNGAPALHLASVVTPLLIPDLPVYLWIVGALPLGQAFGQDAIAICERLIIDTGEYPDAPQTLETLAREAGTEGTVALADLAWARSRRWRELLAQSFDNAHVRPLVKSITGVEILVSGKYASTQAWLLVGWLGSRLAWADQSMPTIKVVNDSISDVPHGDVVAIRIDCADGQNHASVRVERHDEMLYAGVDVNGTVSASRTMPVHAPDVVRLVGTLMEEAGEDPIYRAAVRTAAQLAKPQVRNGALV